jgi:flagellar motor protein MotB
MNGTWRAQGFIAWAGRGLCLVGLASILGSCALWNDMFSSPSPGEKVAASQEAPNLGTVPTKAPTVTPADQRQQITQGLVADQQNAAYSGQQLTAQPSGGSTPPAPAQPPPTASEASTSTGATAPASSEPTTAASATPPAPASSGGATMGSAPVEQSTLPPPPATSTQMAAAPTASAPVQTAAAPAAQPAAVPQPASPYYSLPVSGAPPPIAPAQVAAAPVPSSATPIIQDQARLQSLLSTVQGPYAGVPGTQSAAVDNARPIAVIFFRDGSAALNDRDLGVLHDVVLLQEQQGGQLRVVGHASEHSATMDYAQHQAVNDELSMKRATAVGGTLLRMGAPSNLVAISAVGDQQPVFYEFMPTGEAGNRRVEIFLYR